MKSSLLLIDLNVSFGQRNHLRQDRCHVEVLHLVPLIRGLVEDVRSIRSLRRLTVVHDVGDEVVPSLFVVLLVRCGEDVTEIDVPELKRMSQNC